MKKLLISMQVWGLIMMQFQGIAVYAETPTPNAVSKLTKQQIEARRDARQKEIRTKRKQAIDKFYQAVKILELDKVEEEIIQLEKLTKQLGLTTVGVDQLTAQTVANSPPRSEWTPENVAKWKKDLAEAKKTLNTREADYSQALSAYNSCRNSTFSSMCQAKRDAKNQKHQAMREVAKKVAVLENRLKPSRAQGSNANGERERIENSRPIVANMNAKKEELYRQRDAYINRVKSRAYKAKKLASEATAIAMELIGSQTNDQFILSKITGKAAADDVASHNINLLALTSAGTFQLDCKDISDCPCVSYHLHKAATAIYVATKIRETGANNENTQDARNSDYYDLDETYDDQMKAYERAAGVKRQLLDSAKIQVESKDELKEMFAWVNASARQELWGKQVRYKAAQQHIASSLAHQKNAKSSFDSIKKIVMILGAVVTVARIAVSVSCSGTGGGCAAALKYLKWASWALGAASVLLTFFGKDKKNAQKSLDRSKAEEAAANIHTHMDCSRTVVPPAASTP